jgi:AcrR family transcriptional regulator
MAITRHSARRTSQNTKPGEPLDDRTAIDERKLREEHLLDAAASLLVRWGYRKTTIDDVAHEAGVGKGTIYLHWKDKNEMFRAAIWREQLRYSEEVKRRIAADPVGGLLHRVIVHAFMATLSNPLMAAAFGGQSDIFNGFLSAYDPKFLNQLVGDADAYVAQLQQAGLIRADIPVSVITFMFTAFKVGIINAPDVVGKERTPSMEAVAEELSDLVRRWLEPEQLPGKSEAGKQLFSEFIDNARDSAHI